MTTLFSIYLFSVTNCFLIVDQKVIKVKQLSFCFHFVLRQFGFFLVTSDVRLTAPLPVTLPVQSLILMSSSWLDKGCFCVSEVMPWMQNGYGGNTEGDLIFCCV